MLISDQLQCELKNVKCDENGRFILVEALIQEIHSFKFVHTEPL